MSEQLYNVVRFAQAGGRRIIKRNVTLKEAQEICNDPETSSHTARKPQGCDGDEAMIDRWSEKQKHWFYGYESR
jgi:hypothetical protein